MYDTKPLKNQMIVIKNIQFESSHVLRDMHVTPMNIGISWRSTQLSPREIYGESDNA